jgi:hypothetical protein
MRATNQKTLMAVVAGVVILVCGFVVFRTATANDDNVVDIGPVSKPITRVEDIPADMSPEARASAEAGIRMAEAMRPKTATTR